MFFLIVSEYVHFFYRLVIYVLPMEIQVSMVRIPFIGLTPPYFCTSPWIIIYRGIFCVNDLKRGNCSFCWYWWNFLRAPLVEQKLFTLLEHLSSPPVFSGVHVTQSLVLCVCFVDRCLSFCPFSFDHCVVCPSSIYEFWLSLWYLQTLLTISV